MGRITHSSCPVHHIIPLLVPIVPSPYPRRGRSATSVVAEGVAPVNATQDETAPSPCSGRGESAPPTIVQETHDEDLKPSPHQTTDEPAPNEPKLHEQTLRGGNTCSTNTPDRLTIPPPTQHCTLETSAVFETQVQPVSESRNENLSGDGIPRVKVLLCGNARDYFAAMDLKRFKTTCLEYINGVQPNNVRIHPGHGPIEKELDWFFDPNEIAPGGLLVLCVTGHGVRTAFGVDIQTDRLGPKLMDTLYLHTAINKIQVPCTLEVVLGTCTSEAVISGLEQLMVMETPRVSQEAQTLSPLSDVLFKSLLPNHSIPKLSTVVSIIVWAAAVDGGPAYEEANLPNRKGKNDIMIGAICRALKTYGQSISRKNLFKKIRKAVVKYNTVRDKEHFGKTKTEQSSAQITGRYCGPQLACLLGSPGSREHVLNGFAFQALRFN